MTPLSAARKPVEQGMMSGIDLRWLSPLDDDAIAAAVAQLRALLVAISKPDDGFCAGSGGAHSGA